MNLATFFRKMLGCRCLCPGPNVSPCWTLFLPSIRQENRDRDTFIKKFLRSVFSLCVYFRFWNEATSSALFEHKRIESSLHVKMNGGNEILLSFEFLAGRYIMLHCYRGSCIRRLYFFLSWLLYYNRTDNLTLEKSIEMRTFCGHFNKYRNNISTFDFVSHFSITKPSKLANIIKESSKMSQEISQDQIVFVTDSPE